METLKVIMNYRSTGKVGILEQCDVRVTILSYKHCSSHWNSYTGRAPSHETLKSQQPQSTALITSYLDLSLGTVAKVFGECFPTGCLFIARRRPL